MSNGKFWAKKIIGFIICGLAIAALFGLVVMSLWNWVAVDVIGLRAINFWEALGILLLSKILFGGFHKNWKSGPSGRWSPEMKEKWQNMTPEEKEQFKQQWRNKCRTWGRRSTDATVNND